MIVYFDSSALVKLYVDEPGSEAVEKWRSASRVSATSRVALPELLSALARRMKDGSLRPADVGRAVSAVGRDWQGLHVVELDEIRAGDLALKYALRGFDAIHLDAALTVAERASGADFRFSSFDSRQVAAAKAEGLAVLEP